MVSLEKKLLRILRRTVGKPEVSKYEYLREHPRYSEVVVDLLDRKFKVADSLSFYWSYKEIFQDKIYKFDSKSDCPVIIDCGSNYGTSIIYFKTIYPRAKIVAIEADPDIFRLLEWNIKEQEHGDVTLINKAVSSSTSPVVFHHEGADAGRIHPISRKDNAISVKTVNLDSLLQEPVDFLKMDIEGAETDVICSSENLKSVQQLFIEYHSFKDSRQTLSEMLDKLSTEGFRYYIHTQFCSPRPLTEKRVQLGMDMQLNIFAINSTSLL